MNKKYVLYNLREAAQEIQKIISEIETDGEYEYGDYLVAMSHLYHHINTAWNARESTEKEAEECSEKNFNKWRVMPANEDLLLDE